MIMKRPKAIKVAHNPLPTVLLFLKVKCTSPHKENAIEIQKIIPYIHGDRTLLRVRASMRIPISVMMNDIQMEAHNLMTAMR